jgi:septal ring factor EnvC (AmiA/AmiB activator)
MKIVLSKLMTVFAVLLVFVFLASCTSHPNEEQIKAMEETKAAALSAEKTLADKKSESSALEAKVKEKQAELEKVKAEKEKVLQKIEAAKAAEAEG